MGGIVNDGVGVGDDNSNGCISLSTIRAVESEWSRKIDSNEKSEGMYIHRRVYLMDTHQAY